MLQINNIQENLLQQQLDGWLIYDFRRNNDIAYRFLSFTPQTLTTRRFFYWIPQSGPPVKIVHRIEQQVLDSLPGETLVYAGRIELEQHIRSLLTGCRRIAMEYSPNNALPYISKVDAGTFEWVTGFGVQVVSSANLILTHWTAEQIDSHLEAANFLDHTAAKTWQFIADKLRNNILITEWDVQGFITNEFTSHGFETDEGALCAVNSHSANPHYQATPASAYAIRPNDFILIDLSCKKKHPHAVYADITRVAIAASRPTQEQQTIFDIVHNAQQSAAHFIRERIASQTPVYGCEVDNICRQVITSAGYGPYFTHRTGHNLDTQVHGPGTHLDDFETHDTRPLLPHTCYTIEPGIYLPNKFGIRLEYDILITPGNTQITGGQQDAIVCLDAVRG